MKKRSTAFISLIAMCVVLSVLAASAASAATTLGIIAQQYDLNKDDRLDINDVTTLLDFLSSYKGEGSETPAYHEPTIVVGSAAGAPGQTVTVQISIEKNPGVAGAILTVSYNSGLSLLDAVSGEAFSALDYTRPGVYANPCNFSWDSLSGMATASGTVLTLTFEISGSAAAGDVLGVSCTYRTGDIYDEDLNDVVLNVVNGSVTVK